MVWHLVTTAEVDARRYGDSVTVAVLRRPLTAGAVLGAGPTWDGPPAGRDGPPTAHSGRAAAPHAAQ